jgi:hypothetical protein
MSFVKDLTRLSIWLVLTETTSAQRSTNLIPGLSAYLPLWATAIASASASALFIDFDSAEETESESMCYSNCQQLDTKYVERVNNITSLG